MNKKNVLVVSNLHQKKNSLGEWSGEVHPFHVNIVDNDETAIELLHQVRFDMVVVDATDNSIDGKKLNAVLPILQENITVLHYQGESAQQLENNVQAIFDAKKYQRLKRMLMLDQSIQASWTLPAFSLN